MDVKKAIKKRKSIRKFKSRNVPDKLIKEIIDAARLAPSAHNFQPWHFIVISDKGILKKFKEDKVFVQPEMYKAPIVIICCTNPNVYSGSYNKKLENTKIISSIRDLALSSSFLVLRAAELGLGTCFVAWIDKEKVKNIVGIPNNIIVPYIIVMGYPDEKPKPRGRKELSEILHKEKW